MSTTLPRSRPPTSASPWAAAARTSRARRPSLVLLDDDFSSIVAAVRLGRRIFDNIKKAIAFIFAVHVPIAGLSMLPVFFSDWPLLLFPVHIVFLELIIDPSCSLIFEAEEAEANVMQRPPRSANERLFSLATVGWAVLEGLSVLAACVGVFLFTRASQPPDAARALAFLTLVVSFLVIILANRSWTRGIFSMLRVPNPALWWVIGGTTAFPGPRVARPGGPEPLPFRAAARQRYGAQFRGGRGLRDVVRTAQAHAVANRGPRQRRAVVKNPAYRCGAAPGWSPAFGSLRSPNFSMR